MKEILLAVVVGLWATAAIAHSPLEATTPADKLTRHRLRSRWQQKVFVRAQNSRSADGKRYILDRVAWPWCRWPRP